MSETTGPSVTVPASTESSNSQAAYTPSPVRQQQPQVPHPVEHATHRSGPSLTTERIQDVAGFDKSSQPAPVQGQNMATGGFRSSSGVPSEDELNQLYANEAEAQVSILKKEKASITHAVVLYVQLNCSQLCPVPSYRQTTMG